MSVNGVLEGRAALSPLVECRSQLVRADPAAIANMQNMHIHANRHYKRASGALLVYDVTSRSSFENAEKVWLRELKNAADSNSSLLDSLVLVGNKVGRSGVVFFTLPVHGSDESSKNYHSICCHGYRSSRSHRCLQVSSMTTIQFFLIVCCFDITLCEVCLVISHMPTS